MNINYKEPKYKRGWTKEQDEFLIRVYEDPTVTLQEIIDAVGKSEGAIRIRAKALGLKEAPRKQSPFTENAKLCPRCNDLLPFEAFGKNSTKANGLNTYCIPCFKIIKMMAKKKEIVKKDGEKKCTRCGEVKPLSEFYSIGGMCKPCRNERNKELKLEKKKIRGY